MSPLGIPQITSILQKSLDAIIISWIPSPSSSDLETIRGYRVILNEVNNAATNINSTIMKFVNASSTQVVVEGLALGRTYNISLLILSIHLPGPIAGPESITLTGTTYIRSYIAIQYSLIM